MFPNPFQDRKKNLSHALGTLEILTPRCLENLDKLEHLFRGPAPPRFWALNVFAACRTCFISWIAPGANPVVPRACKHPCISILLMTHPTLEEGPKLLVHSRPWQRPYEPQHTLRSPTPYRGMDSEIWSVQQSISDLKLYFGILIRKLKYKLRLKWGRPSFPTWNPFLTP